VKASTFVTIEVGVDRLWSCDSNPTLLLTMTHATAEAEAVLPEESAVRHRHGGSS